MYWIEILKSMNEGCQCSACWKWFGQGIKSSFLLFYCENQVTARTQVAPVLATQKIGYTELAQLTEQMNTLSATVSWLSSRHR